MLFKCRKCSRQKTSSIETIIKCSFTEFVELIYNGGRIVQSKTMVRTRKVVVMRFASEEQSLPNDDSVAW